MSLKRIGLLALSLVIAAGYAAVRAAEPPAKAADKSGEGSSFIRVRKADDGRPLALETAIVTYAPADGEEGPEVDLIGAIHVGDKAYYEKLNAAFKKYEALLYEMVARPGDVPGRSKRGLSELRGGGAIMGLQSGMKHLLELEHQLNEIDYTADNFVHADMSPSEFARSMKDRDESFLKMFFKMMGQGMAAQGNKNAPSDAELLAALFSKDRALMMKRTFAEQFTAVGGRIAALEGPEGSTLITERNKKALEVLRREIDGGKRRLGIFYGAGHLGDMEERLVRDFGLKPDRVEWVEAWNLRSPDGAEKKEDGRGKNPLRAVFDALAPK